VQQRAAGTHTPPGPRKPFAKGLRLNLLFFLGGIVVKRAAALLLAVVLGATVPACSRQEETGGDELVVFAAASMTETLSELKAGFEEEHPGVTVVYNFDSSGTLKTQIQEGAVCDVFISAGQKQMDQLDAQANPEGLDLLLPDSRRDILENRIALCVPEGNPGGIESFDALADRLEAGTALLCMGNADVPVGQYTRRILDYYGLDEARLAEAGRITYASNVKEVVAQVREASVDAGVVYRTDAVSAGFSPVDYAGADMCGQVVYPAAVLKGARDTQLAEAYLDFLNTDRAREVFEAVGFAPAQ